MKHWHLFVFVLAYPTSLYIIYECGERLTFLYMANTAYCSVHMQCTFYRNLGIGYNVQPPQCYLNSHGI